MQLRRVSQSATRNRPFTPSVYSGDELSAWTRSNAKRAMDVGIVLALSPILLPALASVALAVLITSGAPVFFRQKRMGRGERHFLIYKFRTMRPAPAHQTSAIAIESADRVTRLGTLLRRTKIDELPQVFNVLAGEMSLVGPRPKVPEQQRESLNCRPGLTGLATLAFAREEAILRDIAPDELEQYFRKTILSTKRWLDAEYLQHATFWSDLCILVDTALGRWNSYASEVQWSNDQEDDINPSSHAASFFS